jgi:hypothetical protein
MHHKYFLHIYSNKGDMYTWYLQGRSDRGVKEVDEPPDNCSRTSSGRFPVDFQVNPGNYQGMK